MEVVPQYFSGFAAEMRAFVQHVDRRFDKQDELLETIATTVLRHDEVLERHDTMFQQLVTTQQQHSEVLNTHSRLLRTISGNHDDHEARISHLERSVTRLRLKIDN